MSKPFVCVCTPTSNRGWTQAFSTDCFFKQDYPQDRMKWIVVENSISEFDGWTNPTERIVEKQTVAQMRNRCLELALAEPECDYIVFWDDDDYYPPKRISSGVDALEKDQTKDIAASSKMFLLLVRENVLMTTGPFHDNHGTGATWTVRRAYAEKHRFDPTKTRGEEVTFTKDWAAKMIQVKAEDSIVVMGHSRNTVDKSNLFIHPKSYNAAVVNADNGKQVFRARWPVEWDLWKSTFSV